MAPAIYFFCRLLYYEVAGQNCCDKAQELQLENDRLMSKNYRLQSRINLLERELRSVQLTIMRVAIMIIFGYFRQRETSSKLC